MLSKKLLTTFTKIVSEAMAMLACNVDQEDLASGIDYVSIYAQ
jgi:hypothetical protein